MAKKMDTYKVSIAAYKTSINPNVNLVLETVRAVKSLVVEDIKETATKNILMHL